MSSVSRAKKGLRYRKQHNKKRANLENHDKDRLKTHVSEPKKKMGRMEMWVARELAIRRQDRLETVQPGIA